MESLEQECDSLTNLTRSSDIDAPDCPLCTLSFTDHDYLMQHLKRIHSNWTLYEVVPIVDPEGNEVDDLEVLQKVEGSSSILGNNGSDKLVSGETLSVLSKESGEDFLRQTGVPVCGEVVLGSDSEEETDPNQELRLENVEVVNLSLSSEDEEIDVVMCDSLSSSVETSDKTSNLASLGREVSDKSRIINDNTNCEIRDISDEDLSDDDDVICSSWNVHRHDYVSRTVSYTDKDRIHNSSVRECIKQANSGDLDEEQIFTGRSNGKKERNQKIIIASVPCDKDWFDLLTSENERSPLALTKKLCEKDEVDLNTVREKIELSSHGDVQTDTLIAEPFEATVLDPEELNTEKMSETNKEFFTQKKGSSNDYITEDISDGFRDMEFLGSKETANTGHPKNMQFPSLCVNACSKRSSEVCEEKEIIVAQNKEDVNLNESVVCYENSPRNQYSEVHNEEKLNFENLGQRSVEVTLENTRPEIGSQDQLNEEDNSKENCGSGEELLEESDSNTMIQIKDVYSLKNWDVGQVNCTDEVFEGNVDIAHEITVNQISKESSGTDIIHPVETNPSSKNLLKDECSSGKFDNVQQIEGDFDSFNGLEYCKDQLCDELLKIHEQIDQQRGFDICHIDEYIDCCESTPDTLHDTNGGNISHIQIEAVYSLQGCDTSHPENYMVHDENATADIMAYNVQHENRNIDFSGVNSENLCNEKFDTNEDRYEEKFCKEYLAEKFSEQNVAAVQHKDNIYHSGNSEVDYTSPFINTLSHGVLTGNMLSGTSHVITELPDLNVNAEIKEYETINRVDSTVCHSFQHGDQIKEGTKRESFLDVDIGNAASSVQGILTSVNKLDIEASGTNVTVSGSNLATRSEYKCSRCRRNFLGCQLLADHKCVKSSLKPYKCSQCYFACSKKENLVFHIRRCFRKRRLRGLEEPNRPRRMMRGGIESPPVNCFLCYEKVENKFQLVQHLFRLHTDVVNSKSVKLEILSILDISGDSDFKDITKRENNESIAAKLEVADFNAKRKEENKKKTTAELKVAQFYGVSKRKNESIGANLEIAKNADKNCDRNSLVRLLENETDSFSGEIQSTRFKNADGKRKLCGYGALAEQEREKFSCSSCGHKFQSLQYLVHHRINEHSGEVDEQLSEDYFSYVGSIQNTNTGSFDAVKTMPSSCLSNSDCPLERNYTKPHRKEIYSCSKCSEIFNNKGYLLQHMKVHKAGSWKCNFCGKCIAKIRVKSHIVNCIRKFYVKATGKEMNGLECLDSGEILPNNKFSKKFGCKTYKYSSNRRRKFKCPVCLKRFTIKFFLHHLFAHTPFRLCECMICIHDANSDSSLARNSRRKLLVKNTTKDQSITRSVKHLHKNWYKGSVLHQETSSQIQKGNGHQENLRLEKIYNHNHDQNCLSCNEHHDNRNKLNCHTLECRSNISVSIEKENESVEKLNDVCTLKINGKIPEYQLISEHSRKEVTDEDNHSNDVLAGSFKCSMCDRNYRSYYSMYRHRLVKHKDSDFTNEKVSSRRKFKKISALTTRNPCKTVKSNTYSEKRGKSCIQCGKVFQRKEILRLHVIDCTQMRVIERSGSIYVFQDELKKRDYLSVKNGYSTFTLDKSEKCSTVQERLQCSEVAASKDYLNVIDGGEERYDFVGFTKPHVCLYCSLEFSDRFSFTLHQSKHKNENAYGQYKGKFELRVELEKIDSFPGAGTSKSNSVELNEDLESFKRNKLGKNDVTFGRDAELNDCLVCEKIKEYCECIRPPKSASTPTDQFQNEDIGTYNRRQKVNGKRSRKRCIQWELQKQVSHHQKMRGDLSLKRKSLNSSHDIIGQVGRIGMYKKEETQFLLEVLNEKNEKDLKTYQGRDFSGTLCRKMFKHKHSLKQHELSHMYSSEKLAVKFPYFGNREEADVSSHQITDLNNEFSQGKYSCQKCRKPFFCFKALHKHFVSHSELTLYRCLECGKTYKNRISMINHFEKSHQRHT